MKGEVIVDLYKDGNNLTNGSAKFAQHNRHPDVEWGEVCSLVGEAIEAYYGAGNYEEIANTLKQIFKGSGDRYVSNGLLPLINVNNGSFDTIRVIFRAWSEDDLKRDTCKSVPAPEAVKVNENIQKHLYEVAYDLSANNLQPKSYFFTFGAQDDGWWHDVAISSIMEIKYNVP